MSTLETLASKLASDTLKAQKELGNDRLFVEIGNMLATQSQTLEEAYLTEVRVRMAEENARALLLSKVKEARAAAAKSE